MNPTNGNLGSVHVMFSRLQANAMLDLLDSIAAIDSENVFSEDARKLSRKIIRHGRTFSNKGEDKVSVYFYDNEASKLIALIALYHSAARKSVRDRFDEISLSHKKGLGTSQSAEQTTQSESKS